MTDLEFEVLDQLYFPSDAEQVSKALNLEISLVTSTMRTLYSQKLLKRADDSNFEEETLPFPVDVSFVASKRGLLAHNSRA